MRKIVLIYFVLLSFATKAQVETRKMELDTSFLQIGEQTNLRIELVWSGNALDTAFLIAQDNDESEFLDIRSTFNGSMLEAKLTLTVWDTGIVSLPSLALLAVSQNNIDSFLISTPPILVVEPQIDTTKGIFDIKRNLEQGYTLTEVVQVVITSIGVLALLFGFILLWKYLRRKRTMEVIEIPKVPPYDVAISDLNKLKDKNLWQGGAVKEYYEELTFIWRRYIEDQWNIEALEMTSEEIISGISSIPIKPDHFGEISTMLRTADLVKFAKAFPDPTDHLKFFDLTESSIRHLNINFVNAQKEEHD